MLRKKGFVRPSYIIHHRKKQLGNTLIPVIIALAISAVASVAFLKQGADLSTQAKILEAQYEIADLLQQWNRIKSTTSIPTQSDLPKSITTSATLASINTNIVLGSLPLGRVLGLQFVSSSPDYVTLRYTFNASDMEICLKLASLFSSNMAGISTQLDTEAGSTMRNPGCTSPAVWGIHLAIRLD